MLYGFGFMHNEIERKRMEETLRLERDKAQQYLDIAGVMFVALNREQNVTLINKKGDEILGYPEDEILGKNWFDHFLPDSNISEVKAVFDRIIAGDIEPVEYYENPVLTRDGSQKLIAWHNAVVRDETGNILGTLSSGEDITERKRAEQKLQENECFLQGVFNAIQDGISVLDLDLNIIRVNQWMEKMYAAQMPLAGKKCYEVYQQRQSPCPWCPSIPTIETGETHTENVPYPSTEKPTGWIELSAFPLKSDDGNVVSVIEYVKDITKRKRAEDEIRKLNAELEQRVQQRTAELEAVNQELKDFAYVVSHDLKAPLRGISQLGQWLVQDYGDAFDEEGKRMIDLLINRVKRMDGLIGGILEYSRIGRIIGKNVEINLDRLVKEVIDSIAPPGDIQILIESELPVIIGDKTRIAEVFQNLVENAVKFMDKSEGEITINCADEGAWRTFSVADNGPGIDPKYHEKIFQIFQTLESRDIRESTGVGLALVKKIVEFYGGKIWVESTTGKGSKFSFRLPKKGVKHDEQ
jgi:PAS domain S-box-containing protein